MRLDILNIFNLIEENSSVIDLGCGDGELLHLLKNKKNSKVKGIDIDEKKIHKCIEKGLPVFHGDIEDILPHYKDKLYDYAILSLTLHQVKNPENIILQSVRIAKKVIITFPNFANLKIRLSILFNGKLPVCDYSVYEWYSDKYVHFITIKDFENFCKSRNLKILKRKFLPEGISKINPNLFANFAVYCLKGEENDL